MITLDVHDPSHLGDAAACRDRRQRMDRQLTGRYVADKDHGKPITQRIFSCQADPGRNLRRQGTRDWLVWGSQRPGVGDEKSTCKATRSSTIAFKDVTPNTVGATVKLTYECKRLRTAVHSEVAQAVTSTRNSSDFDYPTPRRSFYSRATTPSAKYSMTLRLSLKTDKFALLGPSFVDGVAIPPEETSSNSYSDWNLAKACE